MYHQNYTAPYFSRSFFISYICMMTNLWIATDEEKIWFGDGKYVTKTPSTRYCVEEVSEDLFETLLHIGRQPEHSKTVSYLLYNLLDKK